MNFSVCIDALFALPEAASNVAKTGEDGAVFSPDRRRIEYCREAGAKAIEFWRWWDRDIDEIKRAADDAGLKIAAMCTKFASLTDPAKRGDFKEGLRQSVQAAEKLGCGILIGQTGDDTGAERAVQHKSIVEGLKECIPLLENTGITLAIEPLNTLIDHKGYYLKHSSEAFAIADEVASPKVKILYDIYHQQVTEGNLVNTIRENIKNICHFHCAGLPGRAELQNGEINYPFIFGEIEKTGYQGYVGLEYFPKEEPMGNLKKTLLTLH